MYVPNLAPLRYGTAQAGCFVGSMCPNVVVDNYIIVVNYN